MAFNPLAERGMPIGQQIRNWPQIVPQPYNKEEVDAFTRLRVILMNGIESEAWFYTHQFARHTDNPEIKSLLALTRRIEEQQQTTINWLTPADQSILETTIAYEQLAIELTAYVARSEPDPYLREVFNFGLLEDFDHLYRYGELLDLIEGKDPNGILQGKTLMLPGRPTIDHHNDPAIRLRKHFKTSGVAPLSRLHVDTVLFAEQQTYLFYKSHGFMYDDPIARGLYAEIGEVEEEHVTQYESLIDPLMTWLEGQVFHELTQVYNYYNCLMQETDRRIKRIWEQFLDMEIEHLQLWGAMLRKYDGIEPEDLIGRELPTPISIESNKEYVEQVLQQQASVRLTANGEWAMKDQLPVDWPSYAYQAIVNADGVPSEEIVRRQLERQRRGEPTGSALLLRAREIAQRQLRQ